MPHSYAGMFSFVPCTGIFSVLFPGDMPMSYPVLNLFLSPKHWTETRCPLNVYNWFLCLSCNLTWKILNKNRRWWQADREGGTLAQVSLRRWEYRLQQGCHQPSSIVLGLQEPHRRFSGVGARNCLWLLWSWGLLWLSFCHRYFSLQATHPLGFDDVVRLEIESNICREGGPLPNCFTTPLRQAWTTMEKVTKTWKALNYKKFLTGGTQKIEHGKKQTEQWKVEAVQQWWERGLWVWLGMY